MPGLPQQVVKDAEEAEKLLRQMADGNNSGGNTGEAPAKEEIQGMSIPEKISSAGEGSKDDVLSELEQLRQKYVVLEGKYRAEVPQYAKEKKELQKKLEELQTIVSDLQSEKVEREKVQTQSSLDEKYKALEDELGSETAMAIRKLIESNSSGKQIDDLRREIKSAKEKLGEIETGQKAIHSDSFYDRLTQSVSDWQKINPDPRWHAWLMNVVPFGGGKTYQLVLDEAAAKRDATAVAEIFNAFKKEVMATPSGKKAAIEDLIEPGKSKATDHSETKREKFYTQKEIEDFYEDVRRNKYRGREEAMRKTEADINLAVLTGRVLMT